MAGHGIRMFGAQTCVLSSLFDRIWLATCIIGVSPEPPAIMPAHQSRAVWTSGMSRGLRWFDQLR